MIEHKMLRLKYLCHFGLHRISVHCYDVLMARRNKASEISAGRTVVKVALTERANQAVSRWLDASGGSKQKFMERLVDFFGAAPQSVQQIMVASVPVELEAAYLDVAKEYFTSIIRDRDGTIRAEDDAITRNVRTSR